MPVHVNFIRGTFPFSTHGRYLHITITSSTHTSPTILDIDEAFPPTALTLNKPTSPTMPVKKSVRFNLPQAVSQHREQVPCASSHCPTSSRFPCKNLKCDSELRNKIQRRKERQASLHSDSSAYFSMIKERTRCIKLHCDLSRWNTHSMKKKRAHYESVKREKIDAIGCRCVECRVEYYTHYNELVSMKLDAAKNYLKTLGDYQDKYSLIG